LQRELRGPIPLTLHGCRIDWEYPAEADLGIPLSNWMKTPENGHGSLPSAQARVFRGNYNGLRVVFLNPEDVRELEPYQQHAGLEFRVHLGAPGRRP
jgi:hypothetical protein